MPMHTALLVHLSKSTTIFTGTPLSLACRRPYRPRSRDDLPAAGLPARGAREPDRAVVEVGLEPAAGVGVLVEEHDVDHRAVHLVLRVVAGGHRSVVLVVALDRRER